MQPAIVDVDERSPAQAGRQLAMYIARNARRNATTTCIIRAETPPRGHAARAQKKTSAPHQPAPHQRHDRQQRTARASGTPTRKMMSEQPVCILQPVESSAAHGRQQTHSYHTAARQAGHSALQPSEPMQAADRRRSAASRGHTVSERSLARCNAIGYVHSYVVT